MRIATYNIHACIGTDGRYEPKRIVSILRELDADIVALQEVEGHTVNDLELLAYLGAETGCRTIAGPTMFRDTRRYGNALLTRLPVLSTERIDLSLPRCEPRGALDVVFDWRGQRVHVVATHLGLKPSERRQQVRRLLALFESTSADADVLLGDLNEWLLWGRPLRWLRRHFTNTPHPRTYPSRWPLVALDRIWVSPRSALTSVRAHASPLARLASDHLPLKAELARPQS